MHNDGAKSFRSTTAGFCSGTPRFRIGAGAIVPFSDGMHVAVRKDDAGGLETCSSQLPAATSHLANHVVNLTTFPATITKFEPVYHHLHRLVAPQLAQRPFRPTLYPL